MEYSPVACMRQSSRCCPSDSSGLLAVQFPLGAGDGDALAGAQADEIGFEFGEGGKDIEEQLSHRDRPGLRASGRGPVSRLVPEAGRRWRKPARASGTNLARRSSFGATSVSPSRTVARASTTTWPGSTC